MNTKEAILLEALKQFSQRGYEAVSMRDIAKQLGITQGALYKHYTWVGSKIIRSFWLWIILHPSIC